MRGELTLVVEGNLGTADVSDADIVASVTALIADGVERKAAIAEVAARYAIPKRRVFDLMVAAKSS